MPKNLEYVPRRAYAPLTEKDFLAGCNVAVDGFAYVETDDYVFTYGHGIKDNFVPAVNAYDKEMNPEYHVPYIGDEFEEVYAIVVVPGDEWGISWYYEDVLAAPEALRFPVTVVGR